MNSAVFVLLCTFAAVPAESAPSQPGLAEVIARLKEEIKGREVAVATLRQQVHLERKNLRRRLLDLQGRILQSEKKLEELQKETADLRKEKEKLRELGGALEGKFADFFDLLREQRKELEAVVLRCGVGEGFFSELDAVLEKKRKALRSVAPAVQSAVRGLADSYAALFHQMGGCSAFECEAVMPDGTARKGRCLLVGPFGGVFASEDGGVEGFAAIDTEAACIRVYTEGLPAAVRKAVRRAIVQEGAEIEIPIDPTGGTAVRSLAKAKSLWDFLKAGGIVMIPLGLIALFGAAMVLERFLGLRRANVPPEPLLRRISPLLRSGRFKEVESVLAQVPGPLGRVLRVGVNAARDGAEVVETVLEEAVLREFPRLERFIGAVGVFAAAAPLLGLLGTVSGMIRTFHIVSYYGTGNAQLLSGGISEALISTEAGLVVAIPLVLAYAWLRNRVRLVMADMERACMTVVGAVRAAEEGGGK